MRVGVVLEQCLAVVPGGTGRYAYEVAAALAATAGAGSSVTGWVAAHRNVNPARVPGVLGPRRLPIPARGLVALWERGLPPRPSGADLVLAPTLLYPAGSRTPVVVTVHDTVPWTHPETLTSRGASWHRAAAVRAAREAVGLLVPTRAVAADVVALLGVPAARVHVAPGAPSAALLVRTPAPEPLPGLPAEYVLSLATLEPRKGLDLLVRAMAHPAAPAVPLVVVGQPGWGGVDPAGLAREAGLDAERLVLLGRVPDRDLAAVLARATVLAVPSRAEGFGLPVLEAMAVGTPVVISAIPALREVACGAAVEVGCEEVEDWARALHEVVTKPALRDRLRERGLRRARNFDWSATARRLWEVFAALVP